MAAAVCRLFFVLMTVAVAAHAQQYFKKRMTDDGKSQTAQRLGLTGIRERAGMIGAGVTVTSLSRF